VIELARSGDARFPAAVLRQIDDLPGIGAGAATVRLALRVIAKIEGEHPGLASSRATAGDDSPRRRAAEELRDQLRAPARAVSLPSRPPQIAVRTGAWPSWMFPQESGDPPPPPRRPASYPPTARSGSFLLE
jgi:hypothetical protein